MVHPILIIGAGFAGIGLAIRLKLAGIHDFVVLERADRVGGTWRDNRYPGVGCDVDSWLYSYSFVPNPGWSRSFAGGAEILAYLEAAVQRFGVTPHLRLGVGVTRAVWDEAAGQWAVETTGGETLRARVLVPAVGLALSRPALPDIAGRDSFAGKMLHSARWDDGFSARGQRVAVIGTGASAIQIVPTIAPEAARLTVFQRTPPWIIPKRDREVSALRQTLLSRVPGLHTLLRTWIYWRREAVAVGFVREPRLLEALGVLAGLYLRLQIPDPALRARLKPNYTMGCKRVLPSSTWYPTLRMPHVELVDTPILRIEPRGVVTGGAEGERLHAADTLVFATGFEAAEAQLPFWLVGRGGAALGGQVAPGALSAYLGTTMSGFPNLFLLVGPNTGLGHSSMILMMESQYNYVLGALDTLRGSRDVEVKAEVHRQYHATIQRRLQRTVWHTGGCTSWYRGPGGENSTLWPGSTWEFRRRTRRFDVENYRVNEGTG